MNDLDKRFTKALVEFIRKGKGRRVTIWARLLTRIAGIEENHSNVVKAAKFLKKLAESGLLIVEVRKRFTKSCALNYVIRDDMYLWILAKEDPGRAETYVLRIVRKIEG